MSDPINKVKVNLGNLTKLMEDLNVRHDIKVGIIGDKAFETHEGTEMTNAQLGAIHEFGATINHPGGQPYYFDEKTGLCRFVKKNSDLGRKLIAKGQVTKAHQIVIPTRSFLRMPLLSAEGRKAILKFVKAYGFDMGKKKDYNDLKEEYSKGGYNEAFIKNIAYMIALGAIARVEDAFETGGFGKWAKPTAATLKNRKQNHDPNPLIDTGQLRDAISASVDGQVMGNGGNDQGGTVKAL